MEYPVQTSLILISYEVLDDEVINMVPKNNFFNSYYNLVSNFDSENKKEEEEDNFFEQEVEDKLEVTPEATFYPKVIRAVKNMQAAYSKDKN